MPLADYFTSYQALLVAAIAYIAVVRYFRYKRADRIAFPFKDGRRLLSSMTSTEAFYIMTQLQSLEFPYSINKARSVALLKAGGIPTMSKLFAVTGQNNAKNAGKRAVDTEILLRESQTQPRCSERYVQAVARMNFLHRRYRQAGKILDKDMLHTLGDGASEIIRVVENDEWRTLSDAEKCAVGIFHYNLGQDLEIPYWPLPSHETGWRDGIHFVNELVRWTETYEKEVAKPTATGDQYVKAYVDSATRKMGKRATSLLRQAVGSELDETMRESLCIEAPGTVLTLFLSGVKTSRRVFLRHLALPRPQALAYISVAATPNAAGLYNFSHGGFQPWYILPSLGSIWHPTAILLRLFGARTPGCEGDKYKPMGYDLRTIGPVPQEGRGFDEMAKTKIAIKGRLSEQCAFPTRRA